MSDEQPKAQEKDGIVVELKQRLAEAEAIIREHLDHSADGVLLCTYDGPLYCPKCREPVSQEYHCCYCDTCPNPDDYGTPPLPLFYSQCSTKRESHDG